MPGVYGVFHKGFAERRVLIMNEIEIREVQEAIVAADDALKHLEKADDYLKSARNWGVLDIFGGNLITGLFKHGRMATPIP